jgi:hypothetical protein
MKKELVTRLAATGILVAASMAFAKFPSFDLGRSSKKPSANVTIIQTALLPGGPTLQSGKYKVALNNSSPTPEIGFYQNAKLVAQVPAKLVEQGKKFDVTEVYYDTRGADTQVITQMDLSGWREKILFGKNSGGASSTK